MVDFATQDDIEALWRPLDASESGQVESLLRLASAMVRGRFPDLETRLYRSQIDSQLVADIVASMVVRAMRNPTGIKQETIGPVSYTVDARVASGYLFIDDAEAALLAPAALPGARGFGSIRLSAGLG